MQGSISSCRAQHGKVAMKFLGRLMPRRTHSINNNSHHIGARQHLGCMRASNTSTKREPGIPRAARSCVLRSDVPFIRLGEPSRYL